MKIVLASNSPRRKELLSALEIDFEVRTIDGIDESYPQGFTMTGIAEHISSQKAIAYALGEEELLITADTIVYLDGEVLGKPTDAADACRMLRMLSGQTHQVVTGVTLRTLERTHTFSCVTEVTFAQLTDEQIQYYVTNYKPFDKAGAYGIQEWIGYVGVTGINGSFYNVMGLPVQRLNQELKSFLDEETNNMVNSFIY
ncbi:MAG: septum formation protein Maf [Bacteroidaceae bacterium]|jgi:septum formation protein|nr:septum formation protein Maf [Bacteroidaceae bacterium]